VRAELHQGVPTHPELQEVLDAPWLGTVPEDEETLSLFAQYSRRLGDGEASVLAYCAVHEETAVVDDQQAWKLAQREEIKAVRSLSLIAWAYRDGQLGRVGVETIVDILVDSQAYFPVGGSEIVNWMAEEGLLEPDEDVELEE
jgi:predicted nucleic acid-binding protein